MIIQIYKQMNRVEITENEIHAQAGALLSMIANRAMEAELTGFEFAAGIPGDTRRGVCDECRSIWRGDEGCTGNGNRSYP